MVKKEKPDLFEEIFERYFADKLIDTDYDLYQTSDGCYYCRNCANEIQRLQNCPNCKKNINWRKILIGDDLEFQCTKCNSKIPRFQNCPCCKQNIDWRKRIIGIEWLVIELVKGDKSDIVNYKFNEEFYDRVKNMPDQELMGLYEGLYDNLDKLDVELFKACNMAIRIRYSEAANAWFSKRQYQKWNNFIERVEEKAKKFAFERIKNRSN